MDPRTTFDSAHDLAGALEAVGYLTDDALATVVVAGPAHAAPAAARGRAGHRQDRPGRGAGRRRSTCPLIRLQCYEGIDATQALYDWDFPRQILHLRALEAAPAPVDDVEAAEKQPVRRAVPARPAGAARRCARRPAVLLVDEVDRADDEFEAFLLEVLST